MEGTYMSEIYKTLQPAFEEAESCSGIVIAKDDINNDGKVVKAFRVVDSYDGLCYFLVDLEGREELCYYELLDNEKRKFHFDLEREPVGGLTEEHKNNFDIIVNTIIDTICAEFGSINPEFSKSKHILCYSSHSKSKLSVHIVVLGYYSDISGTAGFFDACVKNIDPKINIYTAINVNGELKDKFTTDRSIYSRNRSFRFFGNTKLGKNRPKVICYDYHTKNSYEGMTTNNLVEIHKQAYLDSFVSYVEGCEPFHKYQTINSELKPIIRLRPASKTATIPSSSSPNKNSSNEIFTSFCVDEDNLNFLRTIFANSDVYCTNKETREPCWHVKVYNGTELLLTLRAGELCPLHNTHHDNNNAYVRFSKNPSEYTRNDIRKIKFPNITGKWRPSVWFKCYGRDEIKIPLFAESLDGVPFLMPSEINTPLKNEIKLEVVEEVQTKHKFKISPSMEKQLENLRQSNKQGKTNKLASTCPQVKPKDSLTPEQHTEFIKEVGLQAEFFKEQAENRKQKEEEQWYKHQELLNQQRLEKGLSPIPLEPRKYDKNPPNTTKTDVPKTQESAKIKIPGSKGRILKVKWKAPPYYSDYNVKILETSMFDLMRECLISLNDSDMAYLIIKAIFCGSEKFRGLIENKPGIYNVFVDNSGGGWYFFSDDDHRWMPIDSIEHFLTHPFYLVRSYFESQYEKLSNLIKELYISIEEAKKEVCHKEIDIKLNEILIAKLKKALKKAKLSSKQCRNAASYFSNTTTISKCITSLTHILTRKMTITPYHSDEVDKLPEVITKYNVFAGFQAKLVDFSIEDEDLVFYLDHLLNVLSAGQRPRLCFIITQMAFFLRNLTPAEAVVAIIGGQGCGKNFPYDILVQFVYGHALSFITDGFEQVTCRFNEMLEGRMLLIVDEQTSIDYKATKGDFNKFKRLVTGKTINLEIKNVRKYTVPNLISYVMISNHEHSIHVEPDDRRFTILECSNHCKGNKEYFDKFARLCMNQNFGNKLYSFLRSPYVEQYLMDISVPLQTDIKSRLVDSQRPNLDFFLEELFVDGNIPIPFDDIKLDPKYPGRVLVHSQTIYSLYLKWLIDTNSRNCTPLGKTRFGSDIRKHDAFDHTLNNLKIRINGKQLHTLVICSFLDTTMCDRSDQSYVSSIFPLSTLIK